MAPTLQALCNLHLPYMIRSYLKLSWRTITRNKVHSFINIAGLSIGIATCLLILLFVRDELTFDSFHAHADRIYRVYAKENWGENQEFTDILTPFPMGPALQENFTEIEHMTRINPVSAKVITGDTKFTSSLTLVDDGFMKMFDFQVLEGTNALDNPSTILLSKSSAKRFFGSLPPINQALKIQLGDQVVSFLIGGIIEDPPANSSIQYDILASTRNLPTLYSENLLTSQWFNISPETYIMIHEGGSAAGLIDKFPALFKTLLGDDFEKSKYFVGLQPIQSIHHDTSLPPGLAPVSDPKYTYILAAIAILILFVACINFVTLSIGKSLKRAKEVGVRKVAGAARQQLIMQFIGEAILITFISLIIGVALAYANLENFNTLSGKSLQLQPDGFFFLTVFVLTTIIGVFAGSYPAFVLSSFKPVSIFKGSVKGDNKHGVRKLLVGLQLVLSVFLISTTLLMYKQLQFLQNKNLGFNKDQLVVVQLNDNRLGEVVNNTERSLAQRIGSAFENAELFKHALSKESSIEGVCAASHDFGDGDWTFLGYTDDKGIYRNFTANLVDADYIQVMGMQVVAGRNFSKDIPSDAVSSIIVNEAWVREYGWDNPIGQRIPGKNFDQHEVIGVVKDFHFTSLYTRIKPLVLAMNPAILLSGAENINISTSPIPKLFVRAKATQTADAVEAIGGLWKRMSEGDEFNFSFVEQALAAQYRADQNLGRIVRIACVLAIIISTLGLYGLAALALQNRTKEISIRKVLGATSSSLLILLTSEYVLLVLLASALSIPLTLYAMNQWLTSFEYRVPIGAVVFVLSAIGTLIIAIGAVGYHVWRTMSAHPAETLKYE